MTEDPRATSAFERARAVWFRRRWPCLFVFALLATSSLAVVTGLPDVYGATATILVEPPQGLASVSPEEIEGRIHRMTETIQSRERLLDLIARFNLYVAARCSESEDAVLRRMRKDIRIDSKGPDSPSRTVTAFTLRFRGPDPEGVAGVVNELAAMYLEEDRRIRSGNVDALASQLAESRAKLTLQEQQIAAFQEKHPGEQPQQQLANLAALGRLDTQLRLASEGRVRAMERRSRLLRDLAAEGAPAAPDGVRETRLSSLRRQLAELRRTYTDKYPDVARLQQEVEALERQPDPAASQPLAPPDRANDALREQLRETEQEIDSLRDEEQRLRLESSLYSQRVESAPQVLRAYQSLARDYETTKTLYDVLLKRYQEAQLSSPEQGRGGQFRLLDKAVPPREPIGPRRPQLAVLGLVVALSAAIGLALASEHADSSFHSADDLRAFTRVPVLATVPRIMGPRAALQRRLLRALVATAGVMALVLLGQAAHRAAGTNDELSALLTRVR
jgi:polysaccharide chain length determinant protein (PEP-CTERM system associated)